MPRALVLAILCLAGACAVDEPAPDIHVDHDKRALPAWVDLEQVIVDGDDDAGDPCALAAALPSSDVCSLMCEPDELAARLISDGTNRGACYQLRCELTPSVAVSVGVCLP